MNHPDLDWIAAQRPQDQTCDPDARERALQALLEHTGPPRGRRRSRQRRGGSRGFRGLAHARPLSVAAAAAAAAAALIVLFGGDHAARDLGPSASATQPTTHHGGATHHSGAVHRPGAIGRQRAAHRQGAVRSPLVRLAEDVSTSPTPAGDATLVARTTTTGGQTVTVYDLYADDGKYYFSPTDGGLTGQVSTGHNLAGGLFAREVAAAKQAATGDVQTAAQNMADAPDPSHVLSPNQPADTAATKAKLAAIGQQGGGADLYDNWVWEDSQDAIIAGSGQPDVRAGVLRILATLPGVTVTNGTSNGEPTLVLTAGTQEVGAGYSEQLTIDANTGVPIGFVGGPPNGAPATTVDYKVSRVTLSELSSGTGTTE